MTRIIKKVPPGIRAAAWRTIDRMPAPAQRLFPHTEEHRRWQMRRMYAKHPLPSASAPTVLFWVPGGMPLLLHVEGVIAAALRLRGYNVHAILCDAPFKACVTREITSGVAPEHWADACARCKASTRSVLDVLGIPFSHIGDFVSPERRAALWEQSEGTDWDNVSDLAHKGLRLGHNVRSTVTRYLQGAKLDGHESIVREYAYSALITAEASSNVLDNMNPMRVFMSHGVYVDWGPALNAALARGIPVTGWKASYLTSRFYFRHVEDPARIDFHKLGDRAWRERSSAPLTPEEDASLQQFLDNRYHRHVTFDMKQLQRYTGAEQQFREKYGIRGDKPVWGVLAHINWDSVSDYSPMSYASFDDWMVDTIEHICGITDVQWLVKVHPIEAYDNPAAGVQRLIETRFPVLPPHVRVVPAEEKISPLEFFDVVDGGVTVYGTAGLELALHGKPVILAGEAHYGGKGFTYDGLTAEKYRALLSRAGQIGRLSTEQAMVARTYAYSYFVQRQIPVPIVRDPESIWWNLQHHRRELLVPGADPFLDFICEKLITGDDFVMDRKLVELADSDAWA